MIYWSFESDPSGPGGPLDLITGIFTGTRWQRLLNQIR
jgi:hypothetical protein